VKVECFKISTQFASVIKSALTKHMGSYGTNGEDWPASFLYMYFYPSFDFANFLVYSLEQSRSFFYGQMA